MNESVIYSNEKTNLIDKENNNIQLSSFRYLIIPRSLKDQI